MHAIPGSANSDRQRQLQTPLLDLLDRKESCERVRKTLHSAFRTSRIPDTRLHLIDRDIS